MYFNADRIDLTYEPYETVVNGVAEDMIDPLMRVQYKSRLLGKDATGASPNADYSGKGAGRHSIEPGQGSGRHPVTARESRRRHPVGERESRRADGTQECRVHHRASKEPPDRRRLGQGVGARFARKA